MGLDIYVHWGVKDEESGEWVGFPPERSAEQMTGFVSAPYAGYLRESWGSLSWTREFSTTLGAPWPYSFYPDWDGGNDGELRCDAAGLATVLAFRDEKLRPWLRDKTARDAYYEAVQKRRDTLPKPANIQEMETQWAELTGDYTAFRQRVADVISFLNFVELHQTEPGLTICFY